MSISYFRRMAAESFRRARASAQPHIDYESLLTYLRNKDRNRYLALIQSLGLRK